MNLLQQYISMIRSCEKRQTNIEGEKHHIFPKSIYGKNNRIVKLTYAEHIQAHRLLWLGFQERYGNGDVRTAKMAKAYWRTVSGGNLSDESAAEARKAVSDSMKGKNNPSYGKTGTFLGKKHTQESRALLSAAKHKNHDTTVAAASRAAKALHQSRTPAQRSAIAAAMGAATKGISKSLGYKWYNDGVKEKKLPYRPDNWQLGRIPQSAEARLKKSIANKGKVFQVVTCDVCGKSGAKPVMTRFHFLRCESR